VLVNVLSSPTREQFVLVNVLSSLMRKPSGLVNPLFSRTREPLGLMKDAAELAKSSVHALKCCSHAF